MALTPPSHVTSVAAASALGASRICISCRRSIRPTVAEAQTNSTSRSDGTGRSRSSSSACVGREGAAAVRFLFLGGAPPPPSYRRSGLSDTKYGSALCCGLCGWSIFPRAHSVATQRCSGRLSRVGLYAARWVSTVVGQLM